MYEMKPVKKGSSCLGKIFKGALIVIGLFVALVIVVAIASPKTTETSLAPAQTGKIAVSDNSQVLVATSESTVAPTIVTLPIVGQDVMVDEVRWKIISVENLGNLITDDNQFTQDIKTSGKFVKVRFEIENRSKDMLSFTGLDLLDNQNRKYVRASNVFSVIDSNEACVLENLNPNITKTCTHIYEVPNDAVGLKANAGDLKIFGGSEALIDLGI